MVERIRSEIKNPSIPVIATGGLSKLIVPLCKTDIERIELLTLDGMYEIYKRNIA